MPDVNRRLQRAGVKSSEHRVLKGTAVSPDMSSADLWPLRFMVSVEPCQYTTWYTVVGDNCQPKFFSAYCLLCFPEDT